MDVPVYLRAPPEGGVAREEGRDEWGQEKDDLVE